MDVVELQRQRIKELEDMVSDRTVELCGLYETLSNLSHVLAYLTDDKFKVFASEHQWNGLIVDYLELGEDS
jgi:hypothetical protein